MKKVNLTCLALILSFRFSTIELGGFAADQPEQRIALMTKLDSVVKELNLDVDSNLDERVLQEPDSVFNARQEKIKKLSSELRELIQKIIASWSQLTDAQQNAVKESLQKLHPMTKTIYALDTGDKKSLDNVIFQSPKKSH